MAAKHLILLAAACVLLLAPRAAQACVATSVKVGNPTAPALKAAEDAFDKAGVQEFFESLAFVNDFRSNTGSTFSCIDSRGEGNELGSPGGDIAELVAGLQTYAELTGTNPSYAETRDILKQFIDKVASPSRRFFYHTSDEKLRKVFHHLKDEGMRPAPNVLPTIMPTDPAVKEAWLVALSTGKYQGCGHMRLLIDNHADYGIKDQMLPRALIRSFYEYFWGTPLESPQRGRVNLSIMQGPLAGQAIAVIDSKGACQGKSPAMPPSHGGSQAFIFHAAAADEFRRDVVTPFFVEYGKSKGKTLDRVS